MGRVKEGLRLCNWCNHFEYTDESECPECVKGTMTKSYNCTICGALLLRSDMKWHAKHCHDIDKHASEWFVDSDHYNT